MRWAAKGALALLLAWMAGGIGSAQSAEAAGGAPEVLDRVIAVVNGVVLLESDVREEMRFAVLQPYSIPPGTNTAQRAAQRLISRSLILQQMKEQHILDRATDEEINKRVSETRKLLPSCAVYHCQTEEGWRKYLNDNDLTLEEVRERSREQLQILAFIELRFRAGIRVSQPEIQDFYVKTLLPQFEKNKLAAPSVASVTARVEEILLQQKVNVLLREWLRSLRVQGSVQILDPGYAQPTITDPDAGEDQ